MRIRKTCTGPDCDKPACSRGLCRSHARQRDRGATLTPLRPRTLKPCTGPQCDRNATNKGLCRAHAMQRHRGQPLEPIGAKAKAPRPGRRIDKYGNTHTPTPHRSTRNRDIGEIGPVPPLDPQIIATARDRLDQMGAGDLIAMLGLDTP